jgi:hypothetical protein
MTDTASRYSEIRHLFGHIDDHRILEIIGLDPTEAELEVAASYFAGMSDVLGEARQPLTGKAAEIYDIVTQDEILEDEERSA